MTPRPAAAGESETARTATDGDPAEGPPTPDPLRIGKYRVLAVLGEGYTGRVFLGSGPEGRLVAVRRAHPHLALDDDFRKRFAREVTAARHASGAHTPLVVEADTEAAVPWTATQFIPGPTLAQTLDALGPLSEAALLRLATGLAAALADLGRDGMESPTIKPSHVILAADGVRLVYGLSTEPATPAPAMYELGATLSAAATGTVGSIDPAAAPPKVGALIESCVHGDPDRRPSPEQLLEAIGPVTPSMRPWPQAVDDLASAQRTVLDRLLRSTSESTTRFDLGETMVAATRADVLAARGRSRRRRALRRFSIVGAALVIAAAIGLALLR